MENSNVLGQVFMTLDVFCEIVNYSDYNLQGQKARKRNYDGTCEIYKKHHKTSWPATESWTCLPTRITVILHSNMSINASTFCLDKTVRTLKSKRKKI